MNIILFQPTIYKDPRGFFYEAFCESEDMPHFVQDNISFSKKGVVRGMHFQKAPFEQGKFIRCLKGAIHDIAVHLATGTKYVNHLSEDNNVALYVPPGFAHGFQAITDATMANKTPYIEVMIEGQP